MPSTSYIVVIKSLGSHSLSRIHTRYVDTVDYLNSSLVSVMLVLVVLVQNFYLEFSLLLVDFLVKQSLVDFRTPVFLSSLSFQNWHLVFLRQVLLHLSTKTYIEFLHKRLILLYEHICVLFCHYLKLFGFLLSQMSFDLSGSLCLGKRDRFRG